MIRLYSPSGELPFRSLTFPDGQRHVELQATDDGGFRQATIEAALTNMDTVFDVLLLKDVLDHNGYVTSLDIRYLLGARMDRRINSRSPATLGVVSRLLLGAGFRTIRVLDPHSEVACQELGAHAVYPTGIAAKVLAEYDPKSTTIIIPDQGAAKRCDALLRPIREADLFPVVRCTKRRDMETGRLSGFQVNEPARVKDRVCLILDDICDGGGTFTGLALELKKAGAGTVDMFATHGIFSKGLPLAEIGHVYTTDSYVHARETEDFAASDYLTVFPISMQ